MVLLLIRIHALCQNGDDLNVWRHIVIPFLQHAINAQKSGLEAGHCYRAMTYVCSSMRALHGSRFKIAYMLLLNNAVGARKTGTR